MLVWVDAALLAEIVGARRRSDDLLSGVANDQDGVVSGFDSVLVSVARRAAGSWVGADAYAVEELIAAGVADADHKHGVVEEIHEWNPFVIATASHRENAPQFEQLFHSVRRTDRWR